MAVVHDIPRAIPASALLRILTGSQHTGGRGSPPTMALFPPRPSAPTKNHQIPTDSATFQAAFLASVSKNNQTATAATTAQQTRP